MDEIDFDILSKAVEGLKRDYESMPTVQQVNSQKTILDMILSDLQDIAWKRQRQEYLQQHPGFTSKRFQAVSKSHNGRPAGIK